MWDEVLNGDCANPDDEQLNTIIGVGNAGLGLASGVNGLPDLGAQGLDALGSAGGDTAGADGAGGDAGDAGGSGGGGMSSVNQSSPYEMTQQGGMDDVNDWNAETKEAFQNSGGTFTQSTGTNPFLYENYNWNTNTITIAADGDEATLMENSIIGPNLATLAG